MMNSLDQSVCFKGCDCPVNSIKGDRFEVLSYLGKHIFGSRVIRMFQEGFEYLGSLVRNSEPFSPACLLEIVNQHGCICAVAVHIRYNNLFAE